MSDAMSDYADKAERSALLAGKSIGDGTGKGAAQLAATNAVAFVILDLAAATREAAASRLAGAVPPVPMVRIYTETSPHDHELDPATTACVCRFCGCPMTIDGRRA